LQRCYRKSRDRKWRQSHALSGSMFCACATRSCAISALVFFYRKWRQSRDRNRPCPEVAQYPTYWGPFHRKWQSRVTGSGPAWAPFFPRFIFLSSSTVVIWLPDVTKGHLTLFGIPLGVRMHNRKLRNIRSDRRSRDPLGSVLGVFSTTSASYNHRKFPLLFSYSVYIYIYIGCVVLQFFPGLFLVVVQNVVQ
jgi:hypothetical protein